MKQKILTTISAPEVGPGTPAELKDLLLRLGDALKRAEPYQAGRLLCQSLEFLTRFFAGAAAGALTVRGPLPKDLNDRLQASARLAECQALLRDALLALTEQPENPIQESLQKVFFVGRPVPGKPIFPRLHTRWLRVAGEPETGLTDLDTLQDNLMRLEEAQDLEDYLEEVLKFLPVLLRWTSSGQAFFRRWREVDDNGARMLEQGNHRFPLLDTSPGKAQREWAPSAPPAPGPKESVPQDPPPPEPPRRSKPKSGGNGTPPAYKRKPRTIEAEVEPLLAPPAAREPQSRPLGPELELVDAGRLDEQTQPVEETLELSAEELTTELKPQVWTSEQKSQILRLLEQLAPEMTVPEFLTEALGELLKQPHGGYLLLHGARGNLTASSLGQACQAPGRRVAAWRVPPNLPLGLFLERLNQALTDTEITPLDPRVLRELQARLCSRPLRERLTAYLGELQRHNQCPTVLVLHRFPDALVPQLAEDLPEQTYLVVSLRSARELDGEIRRLKQHGARQVALDPAHHGLFLDLTAKLSAPDLDGLMKATHQRLDRLRAGIQAVEAGWLPNPQELNPQNFWPLVLQGAQKAQKRSSARLRRVLILLAASRQRLGLEALADLGVAPDALLVWLTQAPDLFTFHDGTLALVSEELRKAVASEYPRDLKDARRHLLAWGLAQLEHAPDALLRLLELYRWASDMKDEEWLDRVVRSSEAGKLRDRLSLELERQGRVTDRVELLTAWAECLEQRTAQDGGEVLLDDLAWAYNSRGLSYMRLGQFPVALADADRAIDIFEKVVREQPRYQNGLAAAHNRRSELFRQLGQPERALDDATEAVKNYQAVVEGQKRTELGYLLAMAYHNRSTILRVLGRIKEAGQECDRAVKLYSKLVKQQPQLKDALASACHTAGVLFIASEHYPQARDQFARAIELYAELVDERPELRNDLASAYSNRGGANHRAGQVEQALLDYTQAIQLRTVMVEEGRNDLRADLAVTCTNRGIVHDLLGQPKEALSDYRKAIALRSQLVEGEGREDLRSDLAFTHICRGSTFRALKQYENAIAEYQRAIADYMASGGTSSKSELAAAYNSLGVTCLEQGDCEQAVASCGRAIQIFSEMNELSPDMLSSLAVAHNNRGEAYRRLGALASAQQEFGMASVVYQRLADEFGRVDLLADLGLTRNNRAAVSADLGDYPTAVEESSQAIELLEMLAQSDTELHPQLAWAYSCRGDAQRALGNLEEALDDAGQAIDRYLILVEDLEQRHFEDELATTFRSRGLSRLARHEQDTAHQDFTQSLEYLQELFANDPRAYGPSLVKTLLMRARTSTERGDLSGATQDVVAAFSHGQGACDFEEMQAMDSLLSALRTRAAGERERGLLSAAVRDYGEMIRACQGGMARGSDPPDLRADLAGALRQRGQLRHRLHEIPAALEDFDAAIDLYRDLVFAGQAYDLGADMAATCIDRALTYQSSNDNPRAIWNYEHAIETYTILIEQEGRQDLVPELARAHYSRGLLHLSAGAQDTALEDFRRVARILTREATDENATEHLPEVAQALMQCARILDGQEKPAESWDYYQKAASVFQALLERLGRQEMLTELVRCQLAQARLAESRRQIDSASEVLTEAHKLARSHDCSPDLALELLEGALEGIHAGPTRPALDGLLTQLVALWEALVVRPGGHDWPPATQPLLGVATALKGRELAPQRTMLVALACASAQRETNPEVSCNLAGFVGCVRVLEEV